VPQDELVDALFTEIDRSIDRGGVEVDEREAAEGAEWLERIEEENAGEMTPERIAAMEAAAATEDALEGNGQALPMAGTAKAKRIALDEDTSPTAGRRFTRA
jgi:(E)-4-hydroxy-3-methylbut-2-enyl-diphosphate synthase